MTDSNPTEAAGKDEEPKVTRYKLPWNGREIELVDRGITAQEVDATMDLIRADRF